MSAVSGNMQGKKHKWKKQRGWGVGSDGSGQPFMFLVWVRKIPLQISNFSIFFPSDQKNISGSGQKVPVSKASYLLRVKSKLGSGRVGSCPIFGLSCCKTSSITIKHKTSP